jgi:hypothetical protein
MKTESQLFMEWVGLTGYGEETGTYKVPVPAMHARVLQLVELARRIEWGQCSTLCHVADAACSVSPSGRCQRLEPSTGGATRTCYK